MRKIVVFVLTAGIALQIVLLYAYAPSVGAASDRLPDLAMARLNHVQIERTEGRSLLRFDAVIVNVGAGSFELHGSRPTTETDMTTVTQRIYDDAGGSRFVPTTAQMYWSGDGHDHWHARDLEEYELIRLDNGKKVGAGGKEGFCFQDNYQYGSTEPPFYTSCDHNPEALSVTMGLLRGWGDIYPWRTVGQYIDVTGLKSGRYRLWATADATDQFEESNEANNFTWVDIQKSGSSVVVKRYGPAAEPI